MLLPLCGGEDIVLTMIDIKFSMMWLIYFLGNHDHFHANILKEKSNKFSQNLFLPFKNN